MQSQEGHRSTEPEVELLAPTGGPTFPGGTFVTVRGPSFTSGSDYRCKFGETVVPVNRSVLLVPSVVPVSRLSHCHVIVTPVSSGSGAVAAQVNNVVVVIPLSGVIMWLVNAGSELITLTVDDCVALPPVWSTAVALQLMVSKGEVVE